MFALRIASVAAIAVWLPLIGQSVPTFSNPTFRGQDPWVTYWNGNYYYSDSDGAAIWVRQSPTLTGLSTAPARPVWSNSSPGAAGLSNVWAPEIHFLNGTPYIYFAADRNGDHRHRIYVLQGGEDPLAGYAAVSLLTTPSLWSIDPNVFYGPDQNLYVSWSASDDPAGGTPQYLCLARMNDPLHITDPVVRIAAPDQPWEMRVAPIEEGPVGFVRGRTTYVTYSASASWVPDGYAVGLLSNRTGDLLNPADWVKSGPIFDHHGTTYGPGSVVFVPSPDGSEAWNVYHAYDQPDCPAYACRSIRMQKFVWATDGTPLLGYPFDPGVPLVRPSGDIGSPTGWGDSLNGVLTSGEWSYTDAAGAEGSGFGQTFRENPATLAWSISADVQLISAARPGAYGIYPLYLDASNFAEMVIDPGRGVVASHAVSGGVECGIVSRPLPPHFDPDLVHTLLVRKTGARWFSFWLDGVLVDRRMLPLDRGQIGLFTSGADVRFNHVSVAAQDYGWGDAQGDAAEGLPPSSLSVPSGSGYAAGLWDLRSDTAAVSVSSSGWRTIYRDHPIYGDYNVQVEGHLVLPPRVPAPDSGFGLIVSHQDRDNQLVLWLNTARQVVEIISVVQGSYARETLASLPQPDTLPFHQLRAVKSGSQFSFYLDGLSIGQREFGISDGTAGLAASGPAVTFRDFTAR